MSSLMTRLLTFSSFIFDIIHPFHAEESVAGTCRDLLFQHLFVEHNIIVSERTNGWHHYRDIAWQDLSHGTLDVPEPQLVFCLKLIAARLVLPEAESWSAPSLVRCFLRPIKRNYAKKYASLDFPLQMPEASQKSRSILHKPFGA